MDYNDVAELGPVPRSPLVLSSEVALCPHRTKPSQATSENTGLVETHFHAFSQSLQNPCWDLAVRLGAALNLRILYRPARQRLLGFFSYLDAYQKVCCSGTVWSERPTSGSAHRSEVPQQELELKAGHAGICGCLVINSSRNPAQWT